MDEWVGGWPWYVQFRVFEKVSDRFEEILETQTGSIVGKIVCRVSEKTIDNFGE